jgi:hypothetical protein
MKTFGFAIVTLLIGFAGGCVYTYRNYPPCVIETACKPNPPGVTGCFPVDCESCGPSGPDRYNRDINPATALRGKQD